MDFRIKNFVATAIAMICTSVSVSAADLKGFPVAMVCSLPGGELVVGYLSMVRVDGTAIYRAGDIVAVVSADGRVEPSHLRREGDCVGKTIDELRAAGQTIEMSN